MKHLIATLIFFGLLASTASVTAKDHHDRGDHHGRSGQLEHRDGDMHHQRGIERRQHRDDHRQDRDGRRDHRRDDRDRDRRYGRAYGYRNPGYYGAFHYDNRGYRDRRAYGYRHSGYYGPRHRWARGHRYLGPIYVVRDYPRYGLRRPPYGYRWVRGSNQYLLVAIATGVILDIALL